VSNHTRRQTRLMAASIGALILAGLVFAGHARAATANQYRGQIVTAQATLTAWGPTITADETAVSRGLREYRTSARPLITALNHEVRDIHDLRMTLLSEGFHSDVTAGLRLIAGSYRMLLGDVRAAHGGPVPARQVKAAQRMDVEGRALLTHGLKAL
jgi:hypothetical protein